VKEKFSKYYAKHKCDKVQGFAFDEDILQRYKKTGTLLGDFECPV